MNGLVNSYLNNGTGILKRKNFNEHKQLCLCSRDRSDFTHKEDLARKLFFLTARSSTAIRLDVHSNGERLSNQPMLSQTSQDMHRCVVATPAFFLFTLPPSHERHSAHTVWRHWHTRHDLFWRALHTWTRIHTTGDTQMAARVHTHGGSNAALTHTK